MPPQPTTPIGFLVIGAQKAGTTSLFEYMRTHPQIHMPAEKEISFFSRNYDRGLSWYMETMLRDAPSDSVCGEASMGYMGGTPFANIAQNERGDTSSTQEAHESLETIIPRRIKATLPDVRLICLLRDPVARAFSHYQMAVLEKEESQTFDDAINALLTADALQRARIAPTNTNGYVVNGEYGRVLAGFLEVFDKEQLLVVFSDDLSSQPIPTLARIFDFIGVRSDFVPENLNTRYREAATKRRIPGLDLYAWQDAIAKSELLRRIWHGLPDRLHRAIDQAYRVAGYRVAMWNAQRGKTEQGVSAAAQAKLAEHFRSDSQALGELTGLEIPWLASR